MATDTLSTAVDVFTVLACFRYSDESFYYAIFALLGIEALLRGVLGGATSSYC